MRGIRGTKWLLAFLSILPMACTSVRVSEVTHIPKPNPSVLTTTLLSTEGAPVRLVSFGSPVAVNQSEPRVEADQQAGPGELSVEALVQQVLDRNPSLAQMVAAWQAASARYPQVTSLDDPMIAGTIGPGTIAPDDPGVRFAYRLEISQKYPFPGKLGLRGQAAQAEAGAAGLDVEDMRLQLIQSAQDAFYEYYLAYRALEVNQENLRLLKRFRDNAKTRYENGLVHQQDYLQADVEIGKENERRLSLEEMQQIAAARINTLMHLSPDNSLPPPPRQLSLAGSLPEAQVLRAAALARRPDLQALVAHIRAEEANLALAHKEFYPDFEPFFMYDRFMGNMPENKDLASMLGVRMNLPVRQARRNAAVAEAAARLAQRRAELDKQTDQVSFQVQEAYAKTRKSAQAVQVYEKTILPAAKLNVEAAQSAYETGKIPFLSLVEAQRNLVTLRDSYYEAVADCFRRRATLERVIGGPIVPQVASHAGPDRLPKPRQNVPVP
jgi:outer membrane protein, heavy metal efflux system